MVINRAHILKRLIVLFLMFITVFAVFILSSCQKTKTDKEDETAFVRPHIQAPTVFQNGELWYYNQFDSMGEPPFSLPEGSPDIDQGYEYYYSYDHFNAYVGSQIIKRIYYEDKNTPPAVKGFGDYIHKK